MIKVKNYIKDGDKFIPIEEFNGEISDPEYIDSAMELIINGIPVITCQEWDYMDPLWAYIANGFEDLADKKLNEWKTYFPDQPIELIFRIHRKFNQIEIESTPSRGRVKAKANLTEFLTTMSESGQSFFRRMAEILPQYKSEYEYEAKRMEKTSIKLLQSIEN